MNDFFDDSIVFCWKSLEVVFTVIKRMKISKNQIQECIHLWLSSEKNSWNQHPSQQCCNYTNLLSQKFRESNVFTKEVLKLISRNIFC